MHRYLLSIWYRKNHPLALLLAPLGWLYAAVMRARRLCYRLGLARVRRFPVPVVVIGNVAIGGTGKTPLVIWLAGFLREAGYRPGVVCRGYGGRARAWPQQVRADSDPGAVGDEAVLLARRTGCPVVAAPDRAAAVEALLAHTHVDLILSDDGLQHLRLGRDVEVAVIDGVRRSGNGRCLPAGPLREPASRLRSVDLVVANDGASRGEFEMKLTPAAVRRVRDDASGCELEALAGRTVHALCGIGHTQRFFAELERRGLVLLRHEFADHHSFAPDDIGFGDGLPVLMTEKDAVKCRRFAGPEHWYVPIDATLQPVFGHRLLRILDKRTHGQEAA